mmetsp:Transcript_5480/g.8095  ORF Transcript_5480/g.8095 Transcript_5480/m.8095 type:complete len:540 (-) Transcript_5480:23-1642(-)
MEEEEVRKMEEEIKQKLYLGQGEFLYTIKDEKERTNFKEFKRIIENNIKAEITKIYVPEMEKKKEEKKKEEEEEEEKKKRPSEIMMKREPEEMNKREEKIGDKYLIREFKKGDYVDLRIAVCGNVDAGKSTMVGVLTNGDLDDGRGSARSSVFLHKHESVTGRTSSVAQHIIGYDAKGGCINYENERMQKVSWKNIVEKAGKIITFIDLAGHEKYLKTTVFGMVGTKPDYACIMIGANMGVTRMTKEHLGLCLALKIPIIVIVTKVDLCPPNILKETMATIKKIFKLPGVRKLPFYIKSEKDLYTAADNISGGRIAPIIMMSAVTGQGVDYVQHLLNILPKKVNQEELSTKDTEFIIDNTYFVNGVGTVVSGILTQGTIKANDTLKIGPDGNGNFRKVQVKSIQRKRVNVNEASAGHQCCLALKKEKRSNIRKGMVMTGINNAFCCWEFEAEVLVLYHSTTIKLNYQPVIHTMCVRQASKIVSMNTDSLSTGDKSKVRFRFMFRPEFLKIGAKLIFREGRTKGLGMITQIYPVEEKKSK